MKIFISLGFQDLDVKVSLKTLLAANRFVCKICNMGFQRDQNLQLHNLLHNLSWKLR
nr:zinc finger protein GAI-ASSOCIATED FACTOR 1-like [Ipomoea batatas]